ncbi:MAG: hypothetical protein PVG21_06720 [Gammaproteobacteria bacterium]|jgi:hypothetical protein
MLKLANTMIGLFLIVVPPAVSAATSPAGLSPATVKAWCAVGHGGHAPPKITYNTWNQFDLLWGLVDAHIQGRMSVLKSMPEGSRGDFWKMQAAMGNAGSKDELVFLSWLSRIGAIDHMSHPLPRDVGALREIAARLRDRPADEVGGRRTSEALDHFARFESLVDRFAPTLAGACKQ